MNLLTVPKGISALLACAVFATTSLQAQTIVIDSYDDPMFATDAGVEIVSGSMLGGEADYFLWNETEESSTSGGVLTNSIVDQVDIAYDGLDGSGGFNLGLNSVDMTSGGANEGFEIDVVSVTGTDMDVTIAVHSAADDASSMTIENVGAGVLVFPFADFTLLGGAIFPVDFTSVKSIEVSFSPAPLVGDIAISEFRAGAPLPPAVTVDTTLPSIKVLNKKKYKTPRPRHRIKGLASDNVAVQKVEAQLPGKKGWKKAKLRSNGRFIFPTPKLTKRTTRIKIRAIDTSKNRSKVQKVSAKGRL